MKRIALVLIILIIAATAVFAQGRPPMGPPPPDGADPLVAYLGLTDAQKTAWQSARQDFDTAVNAAHDTMKSKQEAVLTPEQKVKLDAFRAAMEVLRPHQGPPPPR